MSSHLPDDVTLRQATTGDHAQVAALIEAAFGHEEGPAVAAMVGAIRRGPFARDEYEWVAWTRDAEAALTRDRAADDASGHDADHVAADDAADDVDREVVGHVVLSGTTLHTPRGDTEVLLLSPLAVRPDRHGQGIGTALVERVVGLADAAGEPLIVVLGDPRFYGRCCFVPSAPHGITQDVPEWAPAEASQVRLLSGYAAHGRPAGRIVYPDYVPTS